MSLLDRKTRAEIKIIKDNLKEQKIKLSDGSEIKIKVRPKFGDKTKLEIKWNKKIEDIDFYVLFQGQPIRICNEGFVYNPNEKEYAKFEAGVTKKF